MELMCWLRLNVPQISGAGGKEIKIKYLFIYLFETEFPSLPRLECNGAISAHHNLRLLGSGNSPASAS